VGRRPEGRCGNSPPSTASRDTTLGRYFARPEVARQVREAVASARREQRVAAAAERVAQKLEEQEVRRKAKDQVALGRQLAADRARLKAVPTRRRRSAYETWLDEHEARQPLTRSDLRTRADDRAADAVAAGGGMHAVIDATGLRTRESVLRSIDPTILVRALDNDAVEPPRDGLRRLVPDPELVPRRAAGESLRQIAAD
jgi:hypothetical protein